MSRGCSEQGEQEDVYKGCPLYIYFLSKQNLAQFKLQLTKYQQSCTYIIVQCIINNTVMNYNNRCTFSAVITNCNNGAFDYG